MKCCIREQAVYCGRTVKEARYAEVDYYPITQAEAKATARAKKRQATGEAQAKRNAENARRWLVQMLNTNFCGRDYHVTLNYDPEHLPKSEEQAAADLTRWLRRVKYACAKAGAGKVKYIGVTEHQDADEEAGVRAVRYHHHVIISCALSRDALEALWGMGRATNADRLQFDKESIEALASYLLKYPKRRHRYTLSRGLAKPVRPRPNDSTMTHAKLGRLLRDGSIYDAAYWQQRMSARLHDAWDVNEVRVWILDSGVPRVTVKLRRRNCGSSRI